MDDVELRTRVGAADLLARYQFLADSGRTRELSELFPPEAIFITNTEESSGRLRSSTSSAGRLPRSRRRDSCRPGIISALSISSRVPAAAP